MEMLDSSMKRLPSRLMAMPSAVQMRPYGMSLSAKENFVVIWLGATKWDIG